MSVEFIVDTTERLPERFATRFHDEAIDAIDAKDGFTIALPGGSIAAAFFPVLARLPIDWSWVDFFWCDERALPPEDPESNFGAAARLWLGPARVPTARIHPLPADADDLDHAALLAEDELIRTAGSPRLDLVLLGMGPDGHVASLFPGHPLLHEEHRFVAAIEDSPKPPPRRLTMTMPVLAESGLVVIAAMGEAKAPALRAALRDPQSSLPVAVLSRRARHTLFVLDRDAASLI